MHESARAFEGEEQPELAETIERLFYFWKDNPKVRISDLSYSGVVLAEIEEYNKRRTAWFGAVTGALELLRYAIEEKGEASLSDKEEIARIDEEMKSITKSVTELLHRGTPETEQDELGEKITEGEEMLERAYTLAQRYHL